MLTSLTGVVAGSFPSMGMVLCMGEFYYTQIESSLMCTRWIMVLRLQTLFTFIYLHLDFFLILFLWFSFCSFVWPSNKRKQWFKKKRCEQLLVIQNNLSIIRFSTTAAAAAQNRFLFTRRQKQKEKEKMQRTLFVAKVNTQYTSVNCVRVCACAFYSFIIIILCIF